MIDEVFYKIDFSNNTIYSNTAYYCLDAEDADKLEAFIGADEADYSYEEISESNWDDIIDGGGVIWYTAYPSVGHSFWFLMNDGQHDEEVFEDLLSNIIEYYEEYEFSY